MPLGNGGLLTAKIWLLQGGVTNNEKPDDRDSLLWNGSLRQGFKGSEAERYIYQVAEGCDASVWQ
jgi:hypothetical protein